MKVSSSLHSFVFSFTVKPDLSGHSRDPRYCPLDGDVCFIQVHFTESKGEKLVFTEAGVHLMQILRLIWGPLNTGLTVF